MMKILYLRNSDAYKGDVIEALKDRGHDVNITSIPDEDFELSKRMLGRDRRFEEDDEFTMLLSDKNNVVGLEKENSECEILRIMSEKRVEIVFTIGFYPCISTLCEYYGIIYVSWSLEPPYSSLFFSAVIHKNNLIFLADKQMAEELQAEGIENIFYLPKGVNRKRCDKVIENKNVEKDAWKLSFLGKIKDKNWEEYFGAKNLKNSTKGYLDGIVACQRHVYGLDFFSKILPRYVLDDLIENSTIAPALGSVETIEHFYREQCFYPKTTIVDRLVMLDALVKIGEVHLYSDDDGFEKKGIINCGNLENIDMLEVIKKTKININITPRGYRDGLYGNALEIMGMGEFLISDYRPELEKEFVIGEELLIYEDVADLLNKISYYEEHEEERIEIARKGQEKVRKLHTIHQRLEVIEERIERFRKDSCCDGK